MLRTLHGRTREVGELVRHTQSVRRGVGHLVALVGPPGVGKTRLLGAGIDLADQAGLRVLRARATEVDQSIPYGVINQLVESLGPRTDTTSALATVPDDPTPDGMAAALRWYWFMADLAAQETLALCIDDLHWADEPSRRVLDVLRTRLSDVPILLLVATRELPRSWAIDSAAMPLKVRPLGSDGVAALLKDILGRDSVPEVVAACMEVTGGNPLLVRELARSLWTDGHEDGVSAELVRSVVPETIVVSTYARLAPYGPEAEGIAEALALLGDGQDMQRVASVAGVPMDAANHAVDQLVGEGLVSPTRPLAFEHPLLSAAVRNAMPAGRRSDLHLRAMRMFRDLPDGLDRASAHAMLVDPAGAAEVTKALRDGAARAMARAAPQAAVAYLRRALVEPPPPDDESAVILELATAAYAAQEPDALDLAQLAVERSRDMAGAVTAALGAGHLLTMSGRGREAAELMLETLDATWAPPDLRAAAFGAVALWSGSSIGARDVARPLLAEATAMAADPDSPLPLRALRAVDLAVASGNAAQTVEMAVRAWSDGELLRTTGADQPYVHSTALAVAIAGDLHLLDTWATSLVEFATQTGSFLGRLISVVWPACVREAQGDLAAAEAYARECIELSGRAGIPVATATPVAILANTLLARSGPEAAAEALDLLTPVARDPDLITAPAWWMARAAVQVGLGKYEEALSEVHEIQTWQRRWPATAGGWTFWEPFAVEAHLARGDRETARAIATDGLIAARAFGARRPIVRALRALALTSPAEERNALLTEGIDLARPGGCGVDEATLRIDRAADPCGKEQAIDDLQHALAICDRAGAAYIASQAVCALVERGARPRRSATTGLLSLTPAERRVVDLAAAGSTNRSIAETLFLTEKTVETHLTHAYRKLGVRSRAQLAGIIDA